MKTGEFGAHHQGGIGHDGAAAELAAAGAGVLHPAIVAPFAGIVHVGLALLEQLAVAGEGVDALRAGDVGLDLLLDALLAVGPFDREPFLREQALVVGDQLRQPLERRRGLQHQLFHGRVSLPLSRAQDVRVDRARTTWQPSDGAAVAIAKAKFDYEMAVQRQCGTGGARAKAVRRTSWRPNSARPTSAARGRSR